MVQDKQIIAYPSIQLEANEDLATLPKEHIPTQAAEFYQDFGLLIHPKTGQPVSHLTDYQLKIWDDPSKYRLVVKSQKVGLSTSALLEDFQRALTTAKGKDILVISQTQYHANEHLLTLKTHVINSEKYRKYLIREPSELLFREEKTKVKVAYIKNPDNPLRPSRIIGLGASEGGIWSWKSVAHVHFSDIAASNLKDDSPLFAAAFSRLANTSGTMLIETPPRGPRGKVFEIYQQSLLNPDKDGAFKIFHVTAEDAVKAGLITANFLEQEKDRLGALYPQYYEAEFIAVSGNLFNQSAVDKCMQPLTDVREATEKYMACDLGYVSSKFAIIIGEWEPRLRKIRILVAEEIAMPKYEQMLERILRYHREYKNILNIAIDATSRQEFAMSLKTRLGEPDDWRYIQKKMLEYKSKRWDLAKAMIVVPVLFNLESKGEMASHARQLIEDPRGLLAIDPKFNNLQIALRSAVFDERGQLDKELSPHSDILDAFLMLMQFFRFRRKER